MKVLRALLALLCTIYVLGTLSAADQSRVRIRNKAAVGGGGGGGTPLEDDEHPRMGLTLTPGEPGYIHDVAARVSTGGEWNADFQTYVDDAEDNHTWSGSCTYVTSTTGNRATQLAFIYALRTQSTITGITFTKTAAEFGDEAEDCLVAMANAGASLDSELTATYAYDWAHDTISSGNRSTIVAWWKTWISTVGDPDTLYTNPGGGQWWVPVYTGTMAHWAEAALAALGDGVEEVWLQKGYDKYEWAYYSITDDSAGYFPKYTSWAGTTGGCFLGPVYCVSYGKVRATHAELAWRTANGISQATRYTAANNYLLYWAHDSLYFLRPLGYTKNDEPGGKAPMITQDPAGNSDLTLSAEYGTLLTLGIIRTQLQSTHPNHAGLAAWLLENRTPEDDSFAPSSIRFWHLTRFLGPKNTAQSPSSLGLASDFAYTNGSYQWRTGFESTNDALVKVYAMDFFSAPGVSGAGVFTIDYKGPAMPFGNRQGHDLDANHFPMHNTMLFPDPSRTTMETASVEYEDFGGPRIYGGAFDGSMDTNSLMDLGRADLARYRPTTTDGLGYLYLDNRRAYNGDTVCDLAQVGNSCKVAAYTRAFTYVPPATPGTDSLILFLYDFATTTATTYQHRQAFVFSNEPTVDGSSSAGPSRNGSTARKTQYSGATTITHTLNDSAWSGANKTFLTPLLPSDRNVVKVEAKVVDGGMRKCEDSYGVLRTKDASNDCYTSDGDYPTYVAHWRMEVIPNVSQTTHNFITVIEVCPNTSCSKSTTETVSGTSFIGGRAGATVSVHRIGTGSTGTFVIPSTGPTTLHIADLTAGTRTLTPGSNININGAGAGVAVQVTPSAQGTTKVSIVVSGNGSGAANTITVS